MIYGTAGAVLLPSGDTSGATDTAAINAGLLNGGSVQLAATPPNVSPYWINAPITPTSMSRLWGTSWAQASNFDFYGVGPGNPVGTIINAAPGFTGPAFINMTNTSGSVQNFGVDLAGFYVSGHNYAGSGTHGMLVSGAWGACQLRGVCIFRARGDALHFQADPVLFKIPDDWLVSECKFSACGNGVVSLICSDTWYVTCESSEHAGDAWQIALSQNTRLVGCKGENSGTGFHLTGLESNGQLELQGCSTNSNNGDGFLFDNTGVNVGTNGVYMLTGCRSSNDNQASGAGLAGFRSNGCQSVIMGTGCSAQGTNQVYGASQVGAALGMCFTGSRLTGSTAATHDDGTNTHVLVNQSPVPF